MPLAVRCRAALVALSLVFLPAVLPAQSADYREPANVVSINPLGIVLGWFSAEWEGRLNNTVTGGLQGSFVDIDDDRYVSVDGTLRLYPGSALEGFAVGFTGGYTNAREENGDCDPIGCRDTEGDALGFGVSLDYQWLLGFDRRFAVGLGLGAKRLYWLSGDFDEGSSVLPTARLSVGYAF